MSGEKIGKFIKELRIKNSLSQADLANKLSVTKQAISKWENGRGIPDIEMLKELSKIFNVDIDEIIDGELKEKEVKKKVNKKIIVLSSLIIVVIIFITIFLFTNKPSFNFSTLASDNDLFSIKGVVAYDNNKKSIYISDLDYNSDNEESEYVVAECILYEKDGMSDKQISKCGNINEISKYDSSKAKTLSELLTNIEFNIDNYESTCESYTEDSLSIELRAVNSNDDIITYEIPLILNENCNSTSS